LFRSQEHVRGGPARQHVGSLYEPSTPGPAPAPAEDDRRHRRQARRPQQGRAEDPAVRTAHLGGSPASNHEPKQPTEAETVGDDETADSWPDAHGWGPGMLLIRKCQAQARWLGKWPGPR